ncbi:PEF-CTERM sorting domain-containing protein [Methanosarcina sp.]|uniref:PEF-CTERM sorting domain-containing protein n=1 Tax=Methanosarcina sp. TaxID=2213 RepID=UPI003C716B87
MRINIKMFLLLTVFIFSCCAGNAYASDVIGISMPTFSPQPPFWPGEHVQVTTTVGPAQAGVYVQLQSELGGYFAEGYTDSDGKFTGVYIVPDYALEWAESSVTGGIRFSAYCPDSGMQSGDVTCKIIAKPDGPQVPEFPSMVLPIATILGLVVVIGRRKM